MASTKTKKAPAKKATKAKASASRSSATKKKSQAKKSSAQRATAKKAPAKKAPAKKAPAKKTTWRSRAVVRMVEPGSQVDCTSCGERVKFQAKMRHQQAICNIYDKGKWVRVDHYHLPCYEKAGEPYGPAES